MRASKLLVSETVGALGMPGLAGIGLLLFGIVFGLTALWPAHNRLEEAQAAAARARAEAARPRTGPIIDTSPAAQLKGFYTAFPARVEAPDWLQRIYDAAEKEKLDLVRGEYQVALDAKSDLAKYRMLLPVKGSYGQIRNFLAESLREVPYLALEDVDFQRPKAGDTVIEARIRMTLYMLRR
jgi:hypothetical protein